MKTLLVLTTGRTDVQLVLGDKRLELPRECGPVHDQIEARSADWRLVDAPVSKAQGQEDFELSPGKFDLCTPKLDAALRYLNGTDFQQLHVLILETRRKRRADDPRFSGAVIERRLRDKGIVQIARQAYLKEDDSDYSDKGNSRDAILRREVVRRIAAAIQSSCRENLERVVVSATGGFDAVSKLVEEIAQLHCHRDVKFDVIEIEDGSRKSPPELDEAISRTTVPEPAESFRARWHALSLVERGNLLGAWGAVSYLEGVPDQEWTQVIKWLAHFASSLPLPTGCDLTVLSHQRMAVRAAVRVELALRAGDIPRAVHGTVAVFEAALWDKLGERIERSVDPKKRRFFKVKSGDAPTGDKLLRKGDGSDEDRKRPFEFKETVAGIAWYWLYDGDGGPGARLAKYFIQSDALTQFDAALVRSNIRELRNDVAHDEPTPALMNEARTRMQTAALWSNNDTFLSQPLIQAVLEELGEQCPEQLCINLVSTVRERLLAIS